VPEYTPEHAQAGLDAKLPSIETWPNQFKGYSITIEIPEFTSICPKTGLPDFGKLSLTYEPDAVCLELKAFKYYLLGYRGLGIFYENVVNRILADVVQAIRPVRAELVGEFTPRGGLRSTITVQHRRDKTEKAPC
jgi:7-cyano-7-deazaguanine reductase